VNTQQHLQVLSKKDEEEIFDEQIEWADLRGGWRAFPLKLETEARNCGGDLDRKDSSASHSPLPRDRLGFVSMSKSFFILSSYPSYPSISLWLKSR
jgi:hypothetical protein